VALVGVCAYAALVALLRGSGKRTPSKMNAFDFVVTVALGSTLGTVLLSKEVALVEGVAALAVLIGLQLAVSWVSVRWPRFRGLLTARPTLVLYRGELLGERMRQERITAEEVRAAVRAAGLGSLDEAEAVVLETTGDLSVVARNAARERSTLSDLNRDGVSGSA
jgi:uncharacterized membrane protein YcaP (DUF421 family)